MPDRQLLIEAAQLRAELAELRATIEFMRGRQQDTVAAYETLIATVSQKIA